MEPQGTRRVTVTEQGRRPAGKPLGLLSLILGLTVFVTACGGGTPTNTVAPAATTAPTTAAVTRTTAATTGAAAQATTTRATTTAAASTATRATTTTAAVTTATRATSTTVAGGVGTATRTSTAAGTAVASATAVPLGTGVAAATPNASIAIAGPFPGEANALNGTGATFPQPLYNRWFDDYSRLTNVRVNYQGSGSGAGKNAIRDGTADFAGSDSPMTNQEQDAARGRCGENILHIPTTLGAIVIAYNLPGVTQTLRMDGDTIAGIFSAQITRWNDQRIAALNPGVTLPNQEIIVVRRSDSSGTTQNFTEFLSSANQQWRSTLRSGTTINWPGSTLGAQGNQGVAGEIRNNQYAVGYVELAFAKQSQLPFADVRNQAGNFVTANADSVTAAGQAQAPTLPEDLRGFITNAPGAQSYPITAITWILVCPRQTDQAKAVALTRLLWWSTHEGQRLNAELDYAPLPNALVVRGEQFINQVTVNGQRAFPGR